MAVFSNVVLQEVGGSTGTCHINHMAKVIRTPERLHPTTYGGLRRDIRAQRTTPDDN